MSFARTLSIAGLVVLGFLAPWIFAAGYTGGTASYVANVKVVTLDHGMKLVNITWNREVLWYTVRPMRPGEVAERYEFKNDSFRQYKYVIQEQVSIFP